MDISGVTFNFKSKNGKTEKKGTPSAPKDSTAPSTDVAGEEGSEDTLATAAVVNVAINTIKSAAQMSIQNVEGTIVKAQVSALSSGVSKIASVGVAIASKHPFVAASMVAINALSYGFQQEKFNRESAWSDYSRSQYIENRGFSASYNRNRQQR